MADTPTINTPPPSSSAEPGAAASTPEIKVTTEKGILSVDQAEPLTQVARLSVGDKSAALSQNSNTTVDRSKGPIEETASHKVTVSASPTTSAPKELPPAELPAAYSPAPVPTYYSSEPSESTAYSLNYSGLLGGYSSGVSPSYGTTSVTYAEPVDRPAAAPISFRETPASAPSFAHYLLHAYDVHDMGPGSTQSMIHVRGKNNEIIKSIKLDPGHSKIGVDLPPGDYTFEAVAGKRPDGSKTSDKCDNFGVDIYRDDKAAKTGTSSTTDKTPPPPSTKSAPSTADNPLYA